MQLGYPPPRVACTVPILPKAPSEKAGRAPVGRESANGEGQGGAIVKTDRDLIIRPSKRRSVFWLNTSNRARCAVRPVRSIGL